MSTSPAADSVNVYLREIGRVPMLTHEQEITYGKQVQQMMTLQEKKDTLEKQFGGPLTEQAFAQQVQLSEAEVHCIFARGQRAKKKMIEANLRLVVSVAKKYQKRNVEFLDLIQEGTLGLERGVEKFDPTRGYKFSTYSYWWIRQGITRAIASQSRTIRLPVHITEKLNALKKTRQALTQELGRKPTKQELAAALEIDQHSLENLINQSRTPLSLNQKFGREENTELQHLIEATDANPDESLDQTLLKDRLQVVLNHLSDREREIIELRFGLADGQARSLQQIGNLQNLSRERVRQLQGKAMRKLRQPNVKTQLEYFNKN